MTSSDLDLQRERAARNQSLFREVNERIDELNTTLEDDREVPQYVCECLDLACVERISIPHDEYQRIRSNPSEFFVCPGHEQPHVEEVVHRETRWLVVRKLGIGGEVAVDLAASGAAAPAAPNPDSSEGSNARPRLLFFFDPKDGQARRMDGYIAQVLQRRHNHDTFKIHRIDVTARPDIAERFRIDRTPSLCVVDERRVTLRAYRPKGAAEIEQLLAPWLQPPHLKQRRGLTSRRTATPD